MDDFETLLAAEQSAVERFVKFQIQSKEDAEDVLQEVYLTACRKFSQLRDRDSFKAWLISIARNKCNDYFRRKAVQLEIPIDELTEKELSSDSKYGIAEVSVVRETLSLLGDKDKQILFLYFWKEMSQAEIAKQLGIPVGTVKSRLYTAKQNFKSRYPYHTIDVKGEKEEMKGLPEFMPEYEITESGKTPFSVKWEELMGWFLVPKPGEKLSWGMYDSPSGKCDYIYHMEVTGKAKVHGIEGVELTAKEVSCSEKDHVIDRVFVAQLTDTHCRYLATIKNDGDVKNYITFLDGDEFMPNWGFGENNCGNETNLSVKEDILRDGSVVKTKKKDFLLDIVGRYIVSIGGKSYDTVCVMDIETYNSGVVSEQYLDRNGRTILWRRFNRDDWAIDHYGKLWSELLPENERITVNGVTYVHWYDCMTDYIL
ncbi:MAG: sigma-70 family RNA polymerase sigma factor [Lachnospiraceae bacterium]|nr:sigma-70 family RNA polymerase sigma factor [Lachnospiraceae bacterium]